jgi:hypothetical protein
LLYIEGEKDTPIPNKAGKWKKSGKFDKVLLVAKGVTESRTK